MPSPQRKHKSLRPSKDQLAQTRAYINSMEWKFAKSMPQWPHWYVLREDGSAREFDFVNRLIKNSDIANLPIATSSLPLMAATNSATDNGNCPQAFADACNAAVTFPLETEPLGSRRPSCSITSSTPFP